MSTSIDEFGRDSSLRASKTQSNKNLYFTLKYKGMSWEDVCYSVEEEEKQDDELCCERRQG
jgi:hypothetical protein